MNSFRPDEPTFSKILFCADFSENADFAFSFAVDAASRGPGSRLYLLHVIPESEAQFWKTYIYEVDDVDVKARHDVDERIEIYRARLPERLEFSVEIRVGKDEQEILAFARQQQVDLILMGRQGRGAIQKALFGNVTEKVVRKADCAVLVVPLSYEKRGTHA
jgi:nucleotide-binding universal stress UspA family protein